MSPGAGLAGEAFATEDEAITRANATIFGLAASIFTKDAIGCSLAMRAHSFGKKVVDSARSGVLRVIEEKLPSVGPHLHASMARALSVRMSAKVGMFQVKAN